MNTKQGYIFVVDAKGSAKAWDVVACKNDHPCLLVVRPFTLLPGEVPRNSNFVAIDGGENYQDNLHWGSYRCRRCGGHILMDEDGFILRIRKPVEHEETAQDEQG